MFGQAGRQQAVHRPGVRRIAGGAELVAGHDDDVGGVGQPVQIGLLQQVGLDRADVLPGELLFQTSIGEPGGGPDLPLRRGALGHPGQSWPHLSSGAKDQDVAVELLQIGDHVGIGTGKPLLERLDSFKAARLRVMRCNNHDRTRPIIIQLVG